MVFFLIFCTQIKFYPFGYIAANWKKNHLCEFRRYTVRQFNIECIPKINILPSMELFFMSVNFAILEIWLYVEFETKWRLKSCGSKDLILWNFLFVAINDTHQINVYFHCIFKIKAQFVHCYIKQATDALLIVFMLINKKPSETSYIIPTQKWRR